MSDALASPGLRLDRAKARIVESRALILDVDGTLAETEEVHRKAFNAAFVRANLDWCWGRVVYKNLLRVAGGKERIRAFDRLRGGRHCYRTPRSPNCMGSKPRFTPI